MRVNDIFYSLQGEGRNTGRAAVFVRFSGCNLRCSFCDTDFSSFREMTSDEIIKEISQYPARFVVLTGGEPTLQVTVAFVNQLHEAGFEVAIETNGTLPIPENIDWVTVSPKRSPLSTSPLGEGCVSRKADEIKVIFDGKINPEDYLSFPQEGISEVFFYLQPCDVGDPVRNKEIVDACVAYIKEHPQWRLSLQTHKLVSFP